MRTTIRILDPATVNKIAAGEIIERPASVVKELIENAIDAGAHAIRMDILSSVEGIESIRITDDGTGMSPEDAVFAFTPHATSKIAGIEDLNRLTTLGFRGEALASIAAVARITLVTRHRNSAVSGTKVIIEGGKLLSTSETGAPEGTSVLVEDLFYNTPARKKFQKSKHTEISHIHALLEGICLAHPEISFRLFLNRREQLVTDRTGLILDTIARLYGNEIVKDLVPVHVSLPFMKISGYTSRPSSARKDSSRMIISINQRYVSSPVITRAIKDGYGSLLPRDLFPAAFLSLTIDTSLVDVNVHPTKKLIRLSREKEIAQAVSDAVKTALLSQDLIPRGGQPSDLELSEACTNTESGSEIPYDFSGSPPEGIRETAHTGTFLADRQLRQTELSTGMPLVEEKLPAMEVLGQIGGIYILATSDSGELIVIDQHAVHERILYEQVTIRNEGIHRSQELIVPVLLHRSLKDASILREIIPALAREGFILEEFGKETFLVRAIPVILGKLEDTTMIDAMVSDLVNEEEVRSVNTREKIARIIACRGAIKAGTVCSLEQCQRLVQQIRYAKNPFTCPHGRPTMIRFSRDDLDTLFKRT